MNDTPDRSGIVGDQHVGGSHGLDGFGMILASASPRRAELMRSHGYTFDVQPADDAVEDGRRPGEPAADMVRRYAIAKAADVAGHPSLIGRDVIIVAADTVASIDDEVLGKPTDRDHADAMIRRLAGSTHDVFTGIALRVRSADGATPWATDDVCRTTLLMDPLSDDERRTYLDTGRWRGKAGAFGYQDGNDWVRITDGEGTNVVGLPMPRLAELLIMAAQSADLSKTDTPPKD